MFLHVASARYLGDYRVEVTFSNGRSGVADLTDVIQGDVFEPLKNKSLFSRLTVDDELKTLTWPNGADLAPEYLYFQTFKEDPDLQPRFKEWGYID